MWLCQVLLAIYRSPLLLDLNPFTVFLWSFYFQNPLDENLLRSEDKTKHASSAMIQETGDQNDEADSEVRAVKETGDSNDATAIAEPEPLKAHRLLGGQ